MSIASRRTAVSVCAALCVMAQVAMAADQPAATPSIAPTPATATLNNLMTAYNGESNAHAKYLAYAAQADKEGYRKVAELFRGAAKSEEIHAGFHAKNIAALGGTPKADIATPLVRSTRENLADAIKGETQETQVMYPAFLAQAQADNSKGAAMAFGSAMKIEAGHKELFAQALANLNGWKKATGGFFVCKICGNLTEKLNFKECAICHAPTSEFVQVP